MLSTVAQIPYRPRVRQSRTAARTPRGVDGPHAGRSRGFRSAKGASRACAVKVRVAIDGPRISVLPG